MAWHSTPHAAAHVCFSQRHPPHAPAPLLLGAAAQILTEIYRKKSHKEQEQAAAQGTVTVRHTHTDRDAHGPRPPPLPRDVSDRRTPGIPAPPRRWVVARPRQPSGSAAAAVSVVCAIGAAGDGSGAGHFSAAETE